jgi:hypothetical protein
LQLIAASAGVIATGKAEAVTKAVATAAKITLFSIRSLRMVLETGSL